MKRFRYQRVTDTPAPLLVIGCAARIERNHQFSNAVFDLLSNEAPATRWAAPRGVEWERFPTILRTGCDVEPSNSVMFVADGLDKALEYGADHDQIIQYFALDKLEQSFREVDSGIDPAELSTLRQTFPTILPSLDGSKLWLSRLSEGDRRIATAGEIAYGRWIPGNPRDALVALLVIGENFDELVRRTSQAVSECASPQWRRLD